MTNRAYLRFVEDGGYRRPELWDDAGWAWLLMADVSHPGGWVRGAGGAWSERAFGRVEPLLLDQRFLGGVGNIYADEIAFEAGLSPLTAAGELDQAGQANLYRAIREVLQHAVTNGVAEILNGRANPEHDFPRVHGRAGQPCPRCGTPIAKTRVGGRGTYSCPHCQNWPQSVERGARDGAQAGGR